MRGNQKNKDYVIKWTPEFAYAIGLLTADGCLSKDGRHIDFTSKDIQLIKTFKECLNLDVKIAYKSDGHGRRCPRLQFSHVILYNYLLTIGLTPAKSKTLGELKISDKYFFDFLRGYFDGDGSCHSFWDERWPNSFMFNIRFTSASLSYLKWLHNQIEQLAEVKGGGISKATGSWQLEYAKRDSQILWKRMYYKEGVPCLLRKQKKVENILKIQAQVM